ncbi:PREDICTED: ent-kaur-16-ene synthase, chloroplastic [Populus euphratica]|uniref:ent-kaurene synthase n=1 Tax=Populus euphratica TaxID=75702 RepID=A0AAJ6TNW3_POPEU|nr:PREDICTED: ent-kaur-16-ene synthase, chloroplastic [Populus euphratica]
MSSSRPRFCPSSMSATFTDPASKLVTGEFKTTSLNFHGAKERIKKMFDKIELSVSSYDTAWVAMVPSPYCPETPRFPECTKWILDNQLGDGSWSLPHRHPLLVKDALSSTLACILALKRWGIGEEQINKGLRFIELNSASVTDNEQHKPIGFDIIFPGMIEYAKDLDLNLPFKPTDINFMLHRRALELTSGGGKNLEGRRAYLAYVSEGIGKLQDWEMAMKYQRKNGSLFNSPSTTAAAFIHIQDAECLRYIRSLLQKFGNAVPTIYPLDIYARLSMVDALERLGIDRHFMKEIKIVLDETYRFWLRGEEEIFFDNATCALAFRILRVNGYDVSLDTLNQFSEDHFSNSLGGYLKDSGAALELYRALQLSYPDESLLENQNSWTSDFLKQGLSNPSLCGDRLRKKYSLQVHDALNFPDHADLQRIAIRRRIKHYATDDTRILKTSYRCSTIGNQDFLKLAVEDFNICQSIQREELKHIGRWVVERRLDKLKFARQKEAYCYFSAAATLFAPELSDARMSWAKNSVLSTVVDDFFDVGGSEEELVNLIQLIERWDVNGSADFCSEEVEIIYSAIHSTISETGDKSFGWQGRDVKSHVIKIWLDLLKSMLTEAQWSSNKSVPTLDEYMTTAYVSFALGPIVLPALYFVWPKLSDEVAGHPELLNLFKVMSTCGRLLNDWRSFKRETEEGKLNAVSLYMIHSGGALTEEEAIEHFKGLIDSQRRHLLQLVLQEKDSIIPRPCKDLFWNLIKILHTFYMKDDGFTSNEMISVAKAILNEPISLDEL